MSSWNDSNALTLLYVFTLRPPPHLPDRPPPLQPLPHLPPYTTTLPFTIPIPLPLPLTHNLTHHPSPPHHLSPPLAALATLPVLSASSSAASPLIVNIRRGSGSAFRGFLVAEICASCSWARARAMRALKERLVEVVVGIVRVLGGVEQVRGLIEYGEIEQKLGMITGVGDEVGMFVR